MPRRTRSTIVRSRAKQARGTTGVHGDRGARRTRAGLPTIDMREA